MKLFCKVLSRFSRISSFPFVSLRHTTMMLWQQPTNAPTSSFVYLFTSLLLTNQISSDYLSLSNNEKSLALRMKIQFFPQSLNAPTIQSMLHNKYHRQPPQNSLSARKEQTNLALIWSTKYSSGDSDLFPSSLIGWSRLLMTSVPSAHISIISYSSINEVRIEEGSTTRWNSSRSRNCRRILHHSIW